MTVTHCAEFTIISLLNIIKNALQLLLQHVILVRLSTPKNTQPIVSTAQTCMQNYKNCLISYYLGYRFNFREYETSLKIIVQDKETQTLISFFFGLFFPFILSVSLLQLPLGGYFSYKATFFGSYSHKHSLNWTRSATEAGKPGFDPALLIQNTT